MSQGLHFRSLSRMRVPGDGSHQSRSAPRAALSGPTPEKMIDKFTILPIAACVFSLIVYPLLLVLSDSQHAIQAAEARPEPRFFWPAMLAISVLLTAQNRSHLPLPPHIISLFVYLVFAGASVLWAFSPDHSFVRYLQQVMVVTSIVLPALLATRKADMMRAVFMCFACALILNLVFVYQGASTVVSYGSQGLVNIGYQGYFEGKNYLGECAAVAFLLSLYELFQRGWRRMFGAIVVVIAVLLVFLSDSKTAFGLALVCPLLAWLTLTLRKLTHISPAIILLSIPFCYIILSTVTHYSIFSRISFMLYHDSTLTGRTVIWDFAETEIARSPLFGWGYQSFWLVPDSPSLEAPGWVKMMPNAHNGYYDTMLEMGYVGLALLLAFLVATLHAVGRVADRDPGRAQLLLSLTLFIILYNFFESLWMRGFEFLWVLFVIVAAEIGRYWGPFPLKGPAYRSKAQRSGSPGPSLSARGVQLKVALS
jgi:exopolysaccharide production protein ExoQ